MSERCPSRLHVAGRNLGLRGEPGLDGRDQRAERDHAGQRREPAEQGCAGHRLAKVLQRQVGGRYGERRAWRQLAGELGDVEVREPARGVDQDTAAGLGAVEHPDLMQQRRVLDDERVRPGDGLPAPDRRIVNAAE